MRIHSSPNARGLAVGLLAAALFAAGGCNRADDSTTLPANPDADGAMVDGTATNVPADTDNPAGAMNDGNSATSLTVATAQGVDGTYIADAGGNAVYFLEGDTDGSKCVDACTTVWMPVLVTNATPSGAAGLDAAMVATIQRADGTTQVSYNGHPLYRYTPDTGAGSTAGQGVEDQWGHWYLLTPAGGELEASAMTGGDAAADGADSEDDTATPSDPM